jgi:hypothetical protein
VHGIVQAPRMGAIFHITWRCERRNLKLWKRYAQPHAQAVICASNSDTTNGDDGGKFRITSKTIGPDTVLGAVIHFGYEGGVFNVEIAKSTEVMIMDDTRFPMQYDAASSYSQDR